MTYYSANCAVSEGNDDLSGEFVPSVPLVPNTDRRDKRDIKRAKPQRTNAPRLPRFRNLIPDKNFRELKQVLRI